MRDFLQKEYERRHRERITLGDILFAILLVLAVTGVTAIILSIGLHVVKRVAVETTQIERMGRY